MIGAAVFFSAALLTAPQRAALPPSVFGNGASAGSFIPPFHVYGNRAVSLERIEVRVVYFVPKDDQDGDRAGERKGVEEDFREVAAYAEGVLFPQLTAFHAREFSQTSQMEFSMYEKPFAGRLAREAYEKDFLNAGAQSPLRALELEVKQRLFQGGGDVYDADFSVSADGAYRILLIVYAAPIPKGVFGGREASIPGLTDDAGTSALVFRPLVDPQLSSLFPYAASVVYHELLHAMGVPEFYDAQSVNVLKQQTERQDIMGQGVLEPIMTTFVADDVRRTMGR